MEVTRSEKMNQARRNCSFSPCKSSVSCGILAKHSERKTERPSIEKNFNWIESYLKLMLRNVDHARMVVQKVNSSNLKSIENIVIKELPQRYVNFLWFS
jgi:hypothetical protein